VPWAARPDGNVWFTEFGTNKIGQFIPDPGLAALAAFLARGKAPPAAAPCLGEDALTGTRAFNPNVAVTGHSPVVPGRTTDAAASGDSSLAVAARRTSADLFFQQLGQEPSADQLGALLTGLAPGQS
jgi:hypothetical protein